MSFHGLFILMGRLILHGAKDEGSLEAHAPYLKDAFDEVTKVIQLAEAKLGLGYLSTGQENAEAGTLEEYATVLSFELCKATDSMAMGLAVPWYRRGRTSVESSIPCSHGGRALVVKRAEE
ncbi:hypothetical protein B296_00042152, partial [Ensete ventricosum]